MQAPQQQNPIDTRLAALQLDLHGTLTTPCTVAVNDESSTFEKANVEALQDRLDQIAKSRDWKPSWSDYMGGLNVQERKLLFDLVVSHIRFLTEIKANDGYVDLMAGSVGAFDLVGRGSWDRYESDRFIEADQIIRDALQSSLRLT